MKVDWLISKQKISLVCFGKETIFKNEREQDIKIQQIISVK